MFETACFDCVNNADFRTTCIQIFKKPAGLKWI